ncbi:MAG: tetratricopeptide repeat protein [Planctomycetaceae bacterium]|nr:tetratricopeptide repeat protein [Planctomycetaceae bacterium]
MMERLREWWSFQKRRFWGTLRSIQLPDLLRFEFWWHLLTFPFHWLYENWKTGQRFRHLLFGLPAILFSVLAGMMLGNAGLQGHNAAGTYWTEAESALASQQYQKAELLLTRILRDQSAFQNKARFALAELYSDTGQVDRAESLFEILAPDASEGYSEAHRRLAIILADQISPESSSEDKRRLLWHLDAARDADSPEMALAWARYSLANRDLLTARKQLLKAVDRFPDVYQTLAEIEVRLRNPTPAREYYEKAADHLQKQLERSPENYRARVDYANVLMKLGRLDDAYVILEAGRAINPEENWSSLQASLAVYLHDVLKADGATIVELLEPLGRALECDPNHPSALNRLMSYARTGSGNNEQLRRILERAISQGNEPALAHLALGNLSWLEGDRETASFHFELAVSIRKDMAIVLNNLAWLISHDDPPDLPRALAFVESALEQAPGRPEFLDTRGTIYMKMGNNKKAIIDLEAALPQMPDREKPDILNRLAEIYEALKMHEIADGFRDQAKKLLGR